jgi:hypothetical protein
MNRFFRFVAVVMTAIVALTGWSCNREEVQEPEDKPTIGILEPEFDAESMTAKVMIAPSTNTRAWYYKVEEGTEIKEYTKVEGAAAQEIEFEVIYGAEYTISAYAINKGAVSDTATKKFCQMPTDEVSISIGEFTFDKEAMEVEVTIYPSANATAWYYKCPSYASIGDTEWTKVEGNKEQNVKFRYIWNTDLKVCAYAECGLVKSEEVSKTFHEDLPGANLVVSEPTFDEENMTISFDVTPNETTIKWNWGYVVDGNTEICGMYDDNEARTVSTQIEYEKEYQFYFYASNEANQGEDITIDYSLWGKAAEITIENLTAYSLDAVITKNEKCVRYVVGALHTDAYDRATFIEQARTSLNPSEDYPFAVFNSATESRTFSEQDLVRNSLTTSNENAGILLVPGTSYTIAVYGENAEGVHSVTTKEFVVPEATLNGNVEVYVEVSNIEENSAVVSVSAAESCKMIVGCMDPEVTKVDTENPFDFEGKSDEEIRSYLISMTHAIPFIYDKPLSQRLGGLAIGGTYYAYAIAIKDGKVGSVAFEKFTTKVPSLTGIAKITAAEILEQTSHEILTVKLTADSNATKVRLYAAPANDHAAYKDNLEYIMDANGYQNYREEYSIENGVATANVNIYHPGTNYYLYAVAIDQDGKAGEMVCVAQLAGLDTEYCTTIEEIIEEAKIDLSGTGTVDLVINISGQVDDRISLTVNTDSRSANAQKVWLIRFNGMISEIEDNVKYAFSEYEERNKVLGSYKEAKVGYPLKYEDGGSSWDPKYEALQEYSSTWGGDILVAVVLDTDGKFNIYSYYAAGSSVTRY